MAQASATELHAASGISLDRSANLALRDIAIALYIAPRLSHVKELDRTRRQPPASLSSNGSAGAPAGACASSSAFTCCRFARVSAVTLG